MADKTMQSVLLVIGALIVVGLLFVFFGQPTPQAVTPVTPAPPSIDTLEACAGKATIEDTTVRFDVKDRINLTISPDINATPELNGKQLPVISNIDAGGSFQASPGDGFIVHLREDTSTDTSSSDYYYEVIRGNVPCDGTLTLQKTVGREGAINVTVKNPSSNANVNNTPATGQAMADGEALTFTIVVDGNTNDAYWGNPSSDNPLGILVTCDWNNTVVESCEPAGVSFTREVLPKNYSNVHGADTRVEAFQITSLKSIEEFGNLTFNIVVTAQPSASPNGAGDDDVNLTFYDPTAFPDDSTGRHTWGWIDTDGTGTNIGATNETASINLD